LEKLLQTALDHHKFIYIRQGTICISKWWTIYKSQ